MNDDNIDGRTLRGSDDPVSTAYQQAASEQPPVSLDRAILELARAEAGDAPPVRPQWFVPLAVAATVVIAVSLGFQVLQEPPAVVTEQDFVPARPAAELQPAEHADALRNITDDTAVPPRAAPSSDAAAGLEAVAKPGRRRTDSEVQDGAPTALADWEFTARMTSSADNSERAVRNAADTARREQRSVTEWLQLIETLHREGLQEQSRIELRALRLVYPDTELPSGFPVSE